MYDKSFIGRVSVEDTLQLLFVRYGRDQLNSEITAIFGDEEKLPDGSEKYISFGEYVDKINKRALADHQERVKNKDKVSNPNNVDD